MVTRLLLGFDPGRDKCGLALVQSNIGDSGLLGSEVLRHDVVMAEEAIAHIQALLQRFCIATLIIGNQTTSKQWQQRLRSELIAEPFPEIVPVDERNTTLLARDRYWQMFPPQGLRRLLPQGLRQPPRPIDDIVAILLVERYLGG